MGKTLLPIRGGSTDPPSAWSTPSFFPPSSQVRDFKLGVEDLYRFAKTPSVRKGRESRRECLREGEHVVGPPAGPDSAPRLPWPSQPEVPIRNRAWAFPRGLDSPILKPGPAISHGELTRLSLVPRSPAPARPCPAEKEHYPALSAGGAVWAFRVEGPLGFSPLSRLGFYCFRSSTL